MYPFWGICSILSIFVLQLIIMSLYCIMSGVAFNIICTYIHIEKCVSSPISINIKNWYAYCVREPCMFGNLCQNHLKHYLFCHILFSFAISMFSTDLYTCNANFVSTDAKLMFFVVVRLPQGKQNWYEYKTSD